MEPTIFRYIIRHGWRQQLVLVCLAMISHPFLYGTLELPKIIINDAIGREDFPRDVMGVEFEQIEFLLSLCCVFLVLVLINGGLKYVNNVMIGIVGERMLRRLRYELFTRVLRFPLSRFRKTSQGELVSMITAETEPLGGFIGEAAALPAYQGGQLVTYLIFMFVQDPILGVAAIALYPVQIYVIPKLQRRVNTLAKERVRTVRRLSERIGDTVSGMQEVHANDTAEFERAHFARWVGTIFDIRYRIYRLKFLIKFINNFIAQLTPFFFFSIGGILVIEGDLTIGALVAVLAAYKDLSAPWKEVLNYYQRMEDARVKYDQLIEQFDPPGMLDGTLQQMTPGAVPALGGDVSAISLTLEEEGGVKIVDGATFRFPVSARVAVVGSDGSGRSGLVRMLGRLLQPTSGTLAVDGQNLFTLSQSVTGRRIGYVGPNAYVFAGGVGDNLLYGLKHYPAAEVADSAEQRLGRIREAKETGNTVSDPDAEWIDYGALGVTGREALVDRVIDVLRQTALLDDVLAFGLQGTINPESEADLAARFLEARQVLRERLAESQYKGLVEPFDRDRYIMNMTAAENLLFGTPVGPEFDPERLGDNPYMLSVLDQVGLTDEFVISGYRAASIIVELFEGVPEAGEFFDRFSFVTADELPDYQAVVRRVDPERLDAISAGDRRMLMSLPFRLVPTRHRLGLLDQRITDRLLEARHAFAYGLPGHLRHAVAFFDAEAYNPAATVQDNILFGKPEFGRQNSQQRVAALIADVVDSLGLRRALVEVGLNHEVGIGGARLSAGQRARAVAPRRGLRPGASSAAGTRCGGSACDPRPR